MAKLPIVNERLIEEFGPHPHFAPPGGFTSAGEPDRVVETHCCFCGQQCGIKLKVKDEKIIGFEPWEDFPFNQGKLCPKGVKRYMQDEHPDRLKTPLLRVEGRGFEPVSWDQALDRVTAGIRSVQEKHGKDAFAILGGASLTNEKAYLVGKFARVVLRTPNVDYNGRLCMVSAAAASKKVLGIDRAANPWSDIPKAEVILIAGSNVAECSPITTDYLWRARENGAKIIVLDPRMTPVARTADLYIPVRSGGDIGVFNGMLHVMIERGWIDRRFIEEHTTGFAELEKVIAKYTPEYASKIAGVPAKLIIRAAELWGPARTSFLLHARGIEHHSKGVDNCIAAIQLCVAAGRIGKEGSGYAMITGQGNGQGGREQGQKADQLPGARDIENPAHRKHIASVWGIDEKQLPGKGLSAMEIFQAIHAGKIKGLFSMCFNPMVSLPNQGFIREALEKLEFFGAVDFFMSETTRHADVVLPGSLMEEDEGTTTNVEGRVILHKKVVDPPGEAKQDWKILGELAARLGHEKGFRFSSPREIFEEVRVASKGGISDYAGITYEKIEKNYGVFWPCPSEDHPGTPRLYEGGRFGHADGKAHFHPIEWRPAAEEPDDEYPIVLTTGRVVAHYLSGNQTRRIGGLVKQTPDPYCEMHPRLAEKLGVKDGEPVEVESRRGSLVVRALVVHTIRPDTVFIPYHWPDERSANRCTIPALDPISKIPEYKICAVRVRAAAKKGAS